MNNQTDIQSHFKLRRCILETLYLFFQEYPYGLAELHHFQKQCLCSPEQLNWNIVYLEKCGFVELDKSMDCPPYVSCTATITAKGIDLVENPTQFDQQFPQSQAF
jgi:hypothetical protein